MAPPMIVQCPNKECEKWFNLETLHEDSVSDDVFKNPDTSILCPKCNKWNLWISFKTAVMGSYDSKKDEFTPKEGTVMSLEYQDLWAKPRL